MLQTTIDNGTELLARHASAVRRARTLERWQWILTFVCLVPLIAAIYFKFSATFTEFVLPLSVLGMLAGSGSWIVGRKRDRLIEDIKAMTSALRKLQATFESQVARAKSRIPLSIGFYHLADDIPAAQVKYDSEILSPLFIRSVVAEDEALPKSQIAFVYARLNEDGTIRGYDTSNIRELAHATDASIVVVASDNSASSIKSAIGQPGPKKANLVFTLDRNGDGFARFFAELFTKMREGKHMLEAWVELAPQGPHSPSALAPQTLLVAEGGKIAFPHTA